MLDDREQIDPGSAAATAVSPLRCPRAAGPAPRGALFVYGTLRDDQVLAAVIGRRLPLAASRPALLPDHRCLRVAGEEYPRLERARGENVRGRLLRGLTAADWQRIADFEGACYRFRRTRVWSRGRWVPALYCDYVRACGGKQSWDFPSWQRRHRRAYLGRVRRLMAAGGPAPGKH